MIDELVQKTVSWLQVRLPGAALQLAGTTAAQHVDLPCATGSEYRFRLWFYPDGERGITAETFGKNKPVRESREAFWGWTFELPDFGASPEKLAQVFEQKVDLLLPAPTRIHQRRPSVFG